MIILDFFQDCGIVRKFLNVSGQFWSLKNVRESDWQLFQIFSKGKGSFFLIFMTKQSIFYWIGMTLYYFEWYEKNKIFPMFRPGFNSEHTCSLSTILLSTKIVYCVVCQQCYCPLKLYIAVCVLVFIRWSRCIWHEKKYLLVCRK